MSLASIALLAVVLVLAFMAIKFLIGLVRTVVSAALFIIAAGILLSIVTGTDLFNIGPTAFAALETVNQTVQNFTAP